MNMNMNIGLKTSTCLLMTALVAGWCNGGHAGSLTNSLLCHLTFDNNYNDDSGNGINNNPTNIIPTFGV
jgi:hypothetical protein